LCSMTFPSPPSTEMPCPLFRLTVFSTSTFANDSSSSIPFPVVSLAPSQFPEEELSSIPPTLCLTSLPPTMPSLESSSTMPPSLLSRIVFPSRMVPFDALTEIPASLLS